MTEENSSAEAAAGQANQAEQQFLVQRVYIKDLSVETPMGTDAFLIDQQPSINQDLSTEVQQVAEGLYETVLKLTVTATLEDKTVFLIEIHQAGLFVIKGIEGDDLARVLNTVCPNVLFPYARETIDSTLVKSTFPPLMLPPINFDALYAQALEEQQGKSH